MLNVGLSIAAGALALLVSWQVGWNKGEDVDTQRRLAAADKAIKAENIQLYGTDGITDDSHTMLNNSGERYYALEIEIDMLYLDHADTTWTDVNGVEHCAVCARYYPGDQTIQAFESRAVTHEFDGFTIHVIPITATDLYTVLLDLNVDDPGAMMVQLGAWAPETGEC